MAIVPDQYLFLQVYKRRFFRCRSPATSRIKGHSRVAFSLTVLTLIFFGMASQLVQATELSGRNNIVYYNYQNQLTNVISGGETVTMVIVLSGATLLFVAFNFLREKIRKSNQTKNNPGDNMPRSRTLSVSADILEKNRTDDLIRESESQLADAQRLAQCGSWNFDSLTNKLTWSRELYNIFSTDKDTFVETLGSFVNLVDEVDRDMVSQTTLRCQKDGVAFNIEYHITTKQGEKRIINALGYSRCDAAGRIIRLFGTAQNITDRRKGEESAIETEKKYRYLFEYNPLPMFISDVETLRILECNEEALIKYGYTRDEFLQLTIRDLRSSDVVPINRNRGLVTNSNEGLLRNVWRHKKRNGELMSLDITEHIIDYKDKGCSFIMLNDVTEQLKAEEETQSSYRQLQELTAHLQSVREEERTRISRQVHDELGQQLTALKMDVFWIGQRIESADNSIHRRLEDMTSLIDDAVVTVRRISTDLRPGILDDLGLISAIEWQCQEFERRTEIKSHCNIQMNDYIPLRELSTNIFRIYQEILTNIARHAHATSVETILVEKDGYINLIIKDNGLGFDVLEVKKKKSWGLIGMKERALMFRGELTIESVKQTGTVITLKIPILKPKIPNEIPDCR